MNAVSSRESSHTKNILRLLVIVAAILSIPLIAMQFSDEVNWDVTDFVVMGTLLVGAGLLYEIMTAKIKTKNKRFVAGFIIIAMVVYLWAELAVGIFTNWGS